MKRGIKSLLLGIPFAALGLSILVLATNRFDTGVFAPVLVIIFAPFWLGLYAFLMERKGKTPLKAIPIIQVASYILFFIWILPSLLSICCGPPGFETSDSSAFVRGCMELAVQYNCTADPSTIIVSNYRPSGTTTDQSLMVACTRMGYVDAVACRSACRCPA